MIDDNYTQKLAALVAKFQEASGVHEASEALLERACGLDRAFELEAAEHGIEFEEIVREAVRVSEAIEAALV
jgi:hypothetical protein